jgi:hypothetical protein
MVLSLSEHITENGTAEAGVEPSLDKTNINYARSASWREDYFVILE